jgi:phospholipase A-2-activating protein
MRCKPVFTELSASGDKTIKIWQNSINVRTLTAHSDAVRGLALIPGVGFASSSNDK